MRSVKIMLVCALLFPALGRAAEDREVAKLCAEGLEGSYLGTLKSPGKSLPMRLNLICLDATQMRASLAVLSSFGPDRGADAIVNYGHITVDDDDLILSTFDISAEKRADTSSKTPAGYVKLQLASMRQGLLTGIFSHGLAVRPLALTAKRNQKFPKITSSSKSVPANWFHGMYSVSKSASGPDVLFVDILANVPIIAAQVADNRALRLIDGTAWDGSGVFSQATTLGDAEFDTHTLFYMRGKVTDARHIEFYWISPHAGLVGPLHGTAQD